jgi:hypothetical protein
MNFRSKFNRKHYPEKFLDEHFKSPSLRRLASKHPQLLKGAMVALKLNPLYHLGSIFKRRKNR